jgi:DNA-binding transcriptional LysR family regulator
MEFNDLAAFVSVARAGGFRDAARISGVSASSLSIAVRRLESKLGLRLLNRTTRSVAPTEAGPRLIEKLTPLFGEMEAALDVLNGFREISTAVAGIGVIHLFEVMLRPHLDSGALEPILEPWWQSFPGPFLYYPGRRHLPAPLRAFVDFLKASEASESPNP